MSITSELQRISDARDKIREQLLKLSPNIGVPEDLVASATELSIVSNNSEEDAVSFIQADGTGNHGLSGATIKVQTKLGRGIHKFSYSGGSIDEATVSVADMNGKYMNLGYVRSGFTLSAYLYEQFAPSLGLKLGDAIFLRFHIGSSGSNNAFSIAVKRIDPLNETSKLDECALALEEFVATNV